MVKEKIKSDLRSHADHESQSKFEEKIVDALKNGAHIESPSILIEREIDRMIIDEARALAMRGVKFENYLKVINKTIEQLRKERSEMAHTRVMTSLLLSKLAEVENIEVTEEEISQEIDSMIESSKDRAEEMRKMFSKKENRSSVAETMVRRKALNVLKDISLSGKISTISSTETKNIKIKNSEGKNET